MQKKSRQSESHPSNSLQNNNIAIVMHHNNHPKVKEHLWCCQDPARFRRHTAPTNKTERDHKKINQLIKCPYLQSKQKRKKTTNF